MEGQLRMKQRPVFVRMDGVLNGAVLYGLLR